MILSNIFKMIITMFFTYFIIDLIMLVHQNILSKK